LWNPAIGNRPALIARAASEEDVASAILTARTAGLEIALRCAAGTASPAIRWRTAA
jgi:hypothetical protein